ncbi:MAG: IS1634 family transposase [Anaerolineae bacterium]
MTEELTITTERADDLPLLIAWMERMGLAELTDQHFPVHGNWQGLRPGQVLVGWLTHILSQADHRLNQVQDWAEGRLETLSACLGVRVRALDFSDDRLAALLDLLGEDQRWAGFQAALNQRMLRVYDLTPGRVRMDTTTASGYWEITEDGLFQLGHSKDHRPDLPQLKVALATLDPLGMPLVTQVVAGNQADDPLYIPVIQQVREGVQRSGLLYVGDSKMMSLATRAHLQVGGNYYLGPLSAVEVRPQEMEAYLQPVWGGSQPLTSVERQGADGSQIKIAEGYETQVSLTAEVEGQEVQWVERRWVVRSLSQAQAAETALRERLERAQQALEALNERKQGKRRPKDELAWRQAAEALLKRYHVEGLLEVHIQEQVQERQIRPYGDRPAETRIEREWRVTVARNEAAIEQRVRTLGWRVYASNAPQEVLSLEQAVLAYREEFLVERNFGRLKGKPLSLTPMYLEDDHRATGLVRLLSIGLRVLTLLEHVAREGLAKAGESLRGLYAGNPKRATNRPTAEALLRAFKDIELSFVTLGGQTYRHITPLSELQVKILHLLNIPESIYTSLAANSGNPP